MQTSHSAAELQSTQINAFLNRIFNETEPSSRELQRAQINALRNASLNENEQCGDRAAEAPNRCFSK